MICCQGCGASDPKLNARPCPFLHCALGADVPVTEKWPGSRPPEMAAYAADSHRRRGLRLRLTMRLRLSRSLATRMLCSEICCATDAKS